MPMRARATTPPIAAPAIRPVDGPEFPAEVTADATVAVEDVCVLVRDNPDGDEVAAVDAAASIDEAIAVTSALEADGSSV